jgi:hypothetical protein
MVTASELVDFYLNGNVAYVSDKLKKATKITVLEFAETLASYGYDGFYETKRLLLR